MAIRRAVGLAVRMAVGKPFLLEIFRACYPTRRSSPKKIGISQSDRPILGLKEPRTAQEKLENLVSNEMAGQVRYSQNDSIEFIPIPGSSGSP